MVQKRRYKNSKKSPLAQTHIFLGALCAGFTGLLGLMLYTFNMNDQSWFYVSTDPTTIHNAGGVIGAHVSAFLFYVLGAACFLVLPLLAGLAWVVWNQKPLQEEIDRFFAGIVAIAPLCGLLYMGKVGSIQYMEPGGIVGQWVFLTLLKTFDYRIVAALLATLVFSCGIIMSRMSFMRVFQLLFDGGRYLVVNARHIIIPVVKGLQKGAALAAKAFLWVLVQIKRLLQGADVQEAPESVFAFEQGTGQEPEQESVFWQEKSAPVEKQTAAALPQSEPVRISVPRPQKTDSDYDLPGQELFAPVQKETFDPKIEERKQLATILEEKLARFGIEGKVTAIKPGPVITLFEYEPDIDAKVSKIIALQDDLALALEAMSVRIIAPIPGTSRVGFEVANKERKAVYMRDIIRSKAFKKSFALPIVLGQDTAGDNVVVDLIDMPHLLVAGSTGSGKSVALNTLLVSLLCKLSPQELKLIIIDPKRLEFAAYHDIPHLLFPVITQAHKAAPVLRWLVKVMEERYEMMARFGARSIFDYKTMCAKKGEKDELPFIVLIIDELADLMMIARKDIEDSIARLAQMARAAGIHLIVATQRPSVDVITGVIKVNFPSRMSFRVTSKIDSRTVIDTPGAETLLGKGDMLFLDSHSSRIRRIHGAYVADAEIAAIADHARAQEKVEYVDLQETIATFNKEADAADEPLLREVITFLSGVEEISISLLQRKFKIGYNRSARIIELLEAQGKIMPADGSKMRKVIH